MYKTKYYNIILLLSSILFLIFSIALQAAEFPNNTLKEMRFGAIVPTTGQCSMAYDTGEFTPDFKNICPSSTGVPMHHLVLAPPNTLIRITPYTFTYPGGMFMFTPTGEVKSATETKIFNANNATIIDSGESGQLNIYVAGILNVYVPPSPNSSFPVDLEIDIVTNP